MELLSRVILSTRRSERGLMDHSIKNPSYLVLGYASMAGGHLLAARNGLLVKATRQEILILGCIASGLGRPVSVGEIIDFLYGDDVDGGPDNAASVISVRIYALRLILPFLGLFLVSEKGRGYSLRAVSEIQPVANSLGRAAE